MKRSEISYKAEKKELEKLQARLERKEKALIKAEAKAEKYGVKNMTIEEHYNWLENVETEGIFIKNKEDQEKNSAWFNLITAQEDVKSINREIERAEIRLEKKLQIFEQDKEAPNKLVIEKKNTEGMTFEEEQQLWAEDGITLKSRYTGITPQGNTFEIYANNIGMTERSLHCFTLRINGHTVFTSGLFWRAYTVVKNS